MPLIAEYANPYAAHYDALHQDRDLSAACARIRALLEFTPPAAPRRLLDFGCGTGAHALLLAGADLEVVGVDPAADMIEQARRKLRPGGPPVEFVTGSSPEVLRRCRAGAFHGVISLFNVFNCMASAAEMQGHLFNLRALTMAGGRMLVELWHGDAVLSSTPRSKTRRVRPAGAPRTLITQTLSPTLDRASRRISLHYATTVHDEASGAWENYEQVQEVHFLAAAEYEDLFTAAGWTVAARFPSGRPELTLRPDDWFVTFVLVPTGSPAENPHR